MLSSQIKLETAELLDRVANGDLPESERVIAQLYASIQETEKKIEELQHYSFALKAFVAPIRRLPHDVLQEVFVIYNDTGTKCYHFTKGISRPLVLSKVCREWRNVALASSQLWSTFTIPSDVVAEKSVANAASLLDLYLSRSRNHPLRFEIQPSDEPMTFIQHQQLIRPLIAHAARWEFCHVPSSFAFTEDIPECLPLLNELCLFSIEGSPDDELAFFRAAPELTVLELDGFDFPDELLVLDLPYHQLTWFSGIYVPFSTLRHMLSHMGKLVTLRVDFRNIEPIPSETVVLPESLEQLGIFLAPDDVHPSAFEAFTLPSSLWRLFVGADTKDQYVLYPGRFQAFTRMFTRSYAASCPLKELHLGNIGLTVPACEQILSFLPKLKLLEVWCSTNLPPSALLQMLSRLEQTDSPEALPIFVPSLQKLWVKRCPMIDGNALKLLLNCRKELTRVDLFFVDREQMGVKDTNKSSREVVKKLHDLSREISQMGEWPDSA